MLHIFVSIIQTHYLYTLDMLGNFKVTGYPGIDFFCRIVHTIQDFFVIQHVSSDPPIFGDSGFNFLPL